MSEVSKPIDVICVCSADGRIRPLRLQVEAENGELLRFDIEQILSTKEIPYVGAESQIFLCRARSQDHSRTFQLKYFFRDHSWKLL